MIRTSGGPVIKNLPASAGDMGLIPDPGRFPHAAGQLGLGATSAEPMLHNKRSHSNEQPEHHN